MTRHVIGSLTNLRQILSEGNDGNDSKAVAERIDKTVLAIQELVSLVMRVSNDFLEREFFYWTDTRVHVKLGEG